ncbi:MAG: hypothetical protein QM736_24880 [Vicinamibacterales bacterium]
MESAFAPETLHLAVLQDAQQLGLRGLVKIADFVEENRSAVRQLETAASQRCRAGERSLLVAEQLALDQVSGDCRTVHLHERTCRPWAARVNVRRQQFLARSRFAGEEHARIGSCNTRRLLDDLPEQRAVADHGRSIADEIAEALVLALQIEPFEGVPHGEEDAIARERFLEEVERTDARRFHGIGNRRVPRDHDDRHRGVARANRPQQVDTVSVRQTHVEDIEIGALSLPVLREAGGVRAHGHPMAFSLENQSQRRPDVRLVVDDRNVARTRHVSAGSVTRNAAPPRTPAIGVRSPPHASALRRAIDRPSPMPPGLKLMVGSKSVALATSPRPGPES